MQGVAGEGLLRRRRARRHEGRGFRSRQFTVQLYVRKVDWLAYCDDYDQWHFVHRQGQVGGGEGVDRGFPEFGGFGQRASL